MKEFFKKLVPDSWLVFYHQALAFLSDWLYGCPSKKLIVVGVTGTNGKSTTVSLISQILESAGFKVGLTSTVAFKDGGPAELNRLKMTMPGRFFLQRLLRRMVKAGCKYAVIETSSEGILQNRHSRIRYDAAVFTNLEPEHLERHGGFENYKKAKLQLFAHLAALPCKNIAGRIIPKVIVANLEDEHAKDFLNFAVDKKIGFALEQPQSRPGTNETFFCQDLVLTDKGSAFTIKGQRFETALIGRFNVQNCLAAIAYVSSQGVGLEACAKALAKVQPVPGRMEFISEGQLFQVIVDYAPEPNSLSALYKAIGSWSKKRLIHVLGSAGGGRDKARRAVLGQMAGSRADIVIVTNEDPYDEDPQAIIEQVAAGAASTGKIFGEDLLKITDRRLAIRTALAMARPGDLVLLTGKGSEQAIVAANNKKIPWDERDVVREELKRLCSQDADQKYRSEKPQ